ncbi:uncharacterized protein VTP21DRAFT_7541 [Calcarisporiella thermophila]|uniref:uncharacterized protein n=1 Tax=Calcarisporiella thermophila TaxID=911321 RepID=UPI003742D265
MATFISESFDSARYSDNRPDYTDTLFDSIYAFHTRNGGTENKFRVALDICTGTGKLALRLAERFESVYAIDISTKMLESATKHPNIQYSVSTAEHLEFMDNSVDLITIGQALHWVDAKRFFTEVKRVLRPGGTLAVVGYTFGESPDLLSLKDLVQELTGETMGDYWDPEIKSLLGYYNDVDFGSFFTHVERHYTPIRGKHFVQKQMTLNSFCDYIKTLSVYDPFMRAHPGIEDPVEKTMARISQVEGMTDWDKPFLAVFPAVLILTSDE